MNLKNAVLNAFQVEEWGALEEAVDPFLIDLLDQSVLDVKVSVVICARDEEPVLVSTLKAAFGQSVKPFEIIVVDDGSTDDTSKIAIRYGCKVIKLPIHQESFVGRPELAVRFNVGLAKVSEQSDYVLVLGADSILPTNYVESLLKKVKADSKLKLVSGCIDGEGFDTLQPRGSGRLVDAGWWRNLNGLRFPVVWGWEAWLQYRALACGFKVESFSDVRFGVLRKSGLSLRQAECHGYSMNALGYWWPYALARCFSRFLSGPKYGWRMLKGYVRGRGLKRLDVAGYVCFSQQKRLVSKVFGFIKGGY